MDGPPPNGIHESKYRGLFWDLAIAVSVSQVEVHDSHGSFSWLPTSQSEIIAVIAAIAVVDDGDLAIVRYQVEQPNPVVEGQVALRRGRRALRCHPDGHGIFPAQK